MGPALQQTGKPAKKGTHSLLKGPKAKDSQKSRTGKLPSLKNKIRGVERLLRKAGSDNKVRRSLDAKLSELQSSLAQHSREATERKYAVRYHKIRFFERVKLERRIRQIEGKAHRGHVLSSEEQQQLKHHSDNLQYVLHFPKGERYVSILKSADEPAAQEQLDAERTRLHEIIKRQLAEIAMLAEADEGLGQSPAEPAQDAEADAFFLESSDSGLAQEATSVEALSDASTVQHASPLPEPRESRPTQTAARNLSEPRQSQPQRQERASSAGSLQGNHMPSKKARQHGVSDVSSSAAAGQSIQQDHRLSPPPQPTDSPHLSPQLVQNGKAGTSVKSFKPAANLAAVRRSTQGPAIGVNTAQVAAKQRGSVQKDRQTKEYPASQVACKEEKITAVHRARSLLQKLQQKYLKQEPASQQSVQMGRLPAVGKQLLAGSESQARKSNIGTDQAARLLKAPILDHSFTPEKQPVRTRAQGGRKRRK